jgi:hypothetical protein
MNKKAFERYEAVRVSGVTNMFDVKTVCLLAGISREEYFNIIKNYSEYMEELKNES